MEKIGELGHWSGQRMRGVSIVRRLWVAARFCSLLKRAFVMKFSCETNFKTIRGKFIVEERVVGTTLTGSVLPSIRKS